MIRALAAVDSRGVPRNAASPPVLSLRELRNFVMVAETLHFGRAAERLHIAQPALSRSVKTLEAKLGCALFIRTSREVLLTPAGASLLEDAQAIIKSCDLFYERARALGSDESGELAIGFIPFVEESAEAAIEQFVTIHAGITVHHRRQYDKALRESVSAGELDAGIVLGDPEPADDLLVAPFISLPMVAVVGLEHPLAGRSEITPSELVEYRLPTADSHSPGLLRRVLAPAFADYGLVPNWVPLRDPFSRAPTLEQPEDFVWIQTSELRQRRHDKTETIAIEPPLLCPFHVVSRRENGNRALALFLNLVQSAVSERHSAATSGHADEVLDTANSLSTLTLQS